MAFSSDPILDLTTFKLGEGAAPTCILFIGTFLINGSDGVSGVLAVSRCFEVLLDRVCGVMLSGRRNDGILLGDFNGEPGEVGPFRSFSWVDSSTPLSLSPSVLCLCRGFTPSTSAVCFSDVDAVLSATVAILDVSKALPSSSFYSRILFRLSEFSTERIEFCT